MSTTRLPRSRSAQPPQSAPVGTTPHTSPAPVNAEAHARFGHSFSQVAVTPEDTMPIQRQPDEKLGEAPALHLPFGITIPMPTPGTAPPTGAPTTPQSHPQQTDHMKQIQDMSNNLATTGQRSAEKNDEYLRQ